MSITIKDIAKLAGVSRGTVDRALNNRGKVAPEVKERILKIAKEFGFQKNVLASRLAKKENIQIAVVIPNYEDDIFWNAPFRGIEKMQKTISEFGIYIDYYLFDLFDKNSYSSALDRAIKNQPKAILLAPIFLKETLTYLSITDQNNIPVVCINSEIDSIKPISYIGQDSTHTGILAGKLFHLSKSDKKLIYVLTLGHESKNAIHIQRKINGLKEYNYENNTDFEIQHIEIEDFRNTESLQSVANKISKNKDQLRGIFFTNSRAYQFLNNIDCTDICDPNTTIIGFDLIEENISLLKNGKIDFLLNQNPEKQGYLGIVSLFNYFIYQKDIPSKQYLPADIVMKENYKSYVEVQTNLFEFSV